MNGNENSVKGVWRLRLFPAAVGLIWLIIGVFTATSPRIMAKIFKPSYILAWFILFGFPCLILFIFSFHRVKPSRNEIIKPNETTGTFDLKKTMCEIKEQVIEFVDWHGRKLYGTPDQVEDWRKIDKALRDRFLHWHPRNFEKFVAKLFMRMGYEVQLTSYVRDHGADILLKKDNRSVIVQVKKYPPEHLVSYKEIRDTLGAIFYFRADKAIFVTTSDFDDEAITYAKNKPIELWNFRKLEELVEKYFIRTLKKNALEKEEAVSYTETVNALSESNDFYKQAYPELSEEEAELQEIQEIDMDFEDEEN